MYIRTKKTKDYTYLQIVESKREGKKVKQRVLVTLGRLEKLQANGSIETLIKSLSRFSKETLLVLTGKSNPDVKAKKWGPALIFERLWKTTGIKETITEMVGSRKFEFDVERAIFVSVLHRLLVSGSDRYCDQWHSDYKISGVSGLSLHHFYRAMAFLGEELTDTKDACFSPRRTKDIIEEKLFLTHRDLFTDLELVFFDTTSLYFEGKGGQSIVQHGNSKDHRPDLKHMVVGVILDNHGRPICCEMWPGNITDVKTLIPIVKRLKNRFSIGRICIVADRGMISKSILDWLEDPDNNMEYILGARLRRVNEIKQDVLSRGGRYKEVYPEGIKSKDPSPLKVKEVKIEDRRYIVCLNSKQARKDAADREAIISSLECALKQGAKTLVGNKGYRKYLKVQRGSVSINTDKIKSEERFDGKWVLRTNTKLSAAQVALKYKELWQVEHIFRSMKSLLDTRPIYHQRDDTITGHVFCSFLALVLYKELEHQLHLSGHDFEWQQIKQDLKAMQEIIVDENGNKFALRTQCSGVCGNIFQAVGVAIPPTIRSL
ncbi:MAG: IS1634 family transposase [Candidatus Brocadiales bacterium]|nr:IS1634 family transposase [Candidatus Brocadiales bacterium]